MPRRPASCWIILLALSDASVSTTASRSRSNSAICASTRVPGQRFAETGAQFGQTTISIPDQWVVVGHTKRCQNGSDPVGQTAALGDEIAPFANTPSGILIGL